MYVIMCIWSHLKLRKTAMETDIMLKHNFGEGALGSIHTFDDLTCGFNFHD